MTFLHISRIPCPKGPCARCYQRGWNFSPEDLQRFFTEKAKFHLYDIEGDPAREPWPKGLSWAIPNYQDLESIIDREFSPIAICEELVKARKK